MKRALSSARVLARLRAEILAGTFDDAPRLSEPMLSRRFRVSRGTVREALHQLAAEGLVAIAAGRGATVVRPTADDIEEIFSIRRALEALAARTVARTCTGEDRTALRTLLARMRAAVATGNSALYGRLAAEFHALIVSRAGNRRLATIYQTLENQISRLRTLSLRERGTLMRSYRDHLQIGRAIAGGDAAGAERRLREHLVHVADAQLRQLVGTPPVRRAVWRNPS